MYYKKKESESVNLFKEASVYASQYEAILNRSESNTRMVSVVLNHFLSEL